MAPTDKEKVKLPIAAIDLLRHRGPMLLIDRLLARDGDRATASAHINPDSIFFVDEHSILPEYFIEIIAQTMAAANGYDALCRDSMPKAGFIVGIDDFTLITQRPDSSEFLIKVATTMEFAAMKVMTGQVVSGSTQIASAEIKVWEQSDGDGEQ